jgi:hypothetical protein
MVMHSGYLFRCTIFRNTTIARKVEQNMAVCQEWPLWFQSYNRFMGMLGACTDSGIGDALFLLGLVRTQFFLRLSLQLTWCPYLMVGGVLPIGFESGGAPTHAPGSRQWTWWSDVHVWHPNGWVQQLTSGSRWGPGTRGQVHHAVPSWPDNPMVDSFGALRCYPHAYKVWKPWLVALVLSSSAGPPTMPHSGVPSTDL